MTERDQGHNVCTVFSLCPNLNCKLHMGRGVPRDNAAAGAAALSGVWTVVAAPVVGTASMHLQDSTSHTRINIRTASTAAVGSSDMPTDTMQQGQQRHNIPAVCVLERSESLLVDRLYSVRCPALHTRP